jgi:hypothetical protein
VRASVVLVLVAAGSAPVISGVGLDWLHVQDVRDVLDGQNVTSVAQRIAQREFTPDVRLALVNESSSPTVLGEFGETLHPREGHEYRHVGLAVTNLGRLDVAVHTYHFTAFLEDGEKAPAEVGIAERFEVTQLASGATAVGTVVFQAPPGVAFRSILWQGELSNATLRLGAPAAGSGSGGGPDAPAPDATTPGDVQVLSSSDGTHARTSSGDDVEAPAGQVFRLVQLQLYNDAPASVDVRTSDLTAYDASGQTFPAMTGLEQHFDATVGPHEAASGGVVFVMPQDDAIVRVEWQHG